MKSYKGKPENKHSSQVNMDHSPKEIIYKDIKETYVFQRLLFIHDILSDHSRNKSVDNDKQIYEKTTTYFETKLYIYE